MDPNKKFRIPSEKIKKLIDSKGACMATNKITIEGELVGFMYRESPDFETDNGWRFLSGTETQEYANHAENWMIYDTNTIANYDRSIIPYLDLPVGSELERVNKTEIFRKVIN